MSLSRSDEHLHPFPELPTELILQIMTATCAISHEAALNVSRITKWVRHVCLPYVFGTIVRKAGTTTSWGTSGASSRGLSHLLPPPGCGDYVRNLWIESINMMSSPGELSIFAACRKLEVVALTAKSLRILYTSSSYPTTQGHNPTSTAPVYNIYSLTLLESTYRHEWHFFDGIEHTFLRNITHLRLLGMQQSAYIPIELLPNLTHLALPYLHLRTNRSGDLLRLPDKTLENKVLRMIVLAVDEEQWLYKPWQHRGIPTHTTTINSPRDKFRRIMQAARAQDPRVHVVLSPVRPYTGCEEWITSARGGETIWEKATRCGQDEAEAERLPDTFPPADLRSIDSSYGRKLVA